MKDKKGISLIVLVITIIVAAMLLSITFIALDRNVENASLSGFLEDLKQVEDLASANLIENGESVFSVILTLDDVKEIVGTQKLQDFKNELNINLDNNETKFYKVDLSKLGIVKSTRGNGENGKNDIYVLASNSLHAYYLKGITVKNNTYFSISKKVN